MILIPGKIIIIIQEKMLRTSKICMIFLFLPENIHLFIYLFIHLFNYLFVSLFVWGLGWLPLCSSPARAPMDAVATIEPIH